MNEDSQDKLDQFMRSHRPPAPHGPTDEFEQIAMRIQQRSPWRWWKVAVPALVAASIALSVMLQPEAPQLTESQQQELDLYLANTLGNVYADNGEEEAEPGSEWIELVDYYL